MKTFLVVTLYTGLVAAVDLGGAVWTHFHTTLPGKAAMAAVNPAAAAPVKTRSANHTAVAIPSDT